MKAVERRNRLLHHFGNGMITADEAAIHFVQLLMNEQNPIEQEPLLDFLPNPFRVAFVRWLRGFAKHDYSIRWVGLEDGRSEKQIESDGKQMQEYLADAAETILARIE